MCKSQKGSIKGWGWGVKLFRGETSVNLAFLLVNVCLIFTWQNCIRLDERKSVFTHVNVPCS